MSELPTPEVGADEARRIADQVLSGRAYVEAARPPSLQERVVDWIAEVFIDLFDALSSTGGRGPVAWVIIAFFAALIVFLVSRLLRNLGPLPIRTAHADPVINTMSDRSAGEWLRAAAEAEANDDWRQAVRCRHRALVTTLIDKGLVTARPGQTAGEIYQEVAGAFPHLDTEMLEATWLFNDVWYGWLDAGPEDSHRFATLSESVIANTTDARDLDPVPT